MSLFVQSMIWNGWSLVEETPEFLLFEYGEGESFVSLRIDKPVSKLVRARIRFGDSRELERQFRSLTDLAALVIDPTRLMELLASENTQESESRQQE